jgi:hypothetical protein
MEKPADKTTFLDQIHTDRAKLEATLARVPANRLEEPGAMGDWTVKDVLAHITAWERRLNDWLTINQRPPLSGEIIEQLNQERYQIDRHRPLADVQADFDHIHQTLIGRLDHFLGDSVETPLPVSGREGPGTPAWRLIAACTYLHYEEHIELLDHWLAQDEHK